MPTHFKSACLTLALFAALSSGCANFFLPTSEGLHLIYDYEQLPQQTREFVDCMQGHGWTIAAYDRDRGIRRNYGYITFRRGSDIEVQKAFALLDNNRVYPEDTAYGARGVPAESYVLLVPRGKNSYTVSCRVE